MNNQFLEKIGLTKGEVKVYLSLLKLGQTTSGPIIKESEISSSKVYEILDKLMQKGLASATVKNNTKYFQATSPRKLNNYLEEKEREIEKEKKELQKHLPKFLAQYKEKQEEQNAEIFNGFKAVKTMLWDLIADAKPGEKYFFFGGRDEQYREMASKLYVQYDKYRKEQKLSVKGIVHKDYKKYFKKANAKVKFVDYPTPSNIGIFRNKVAHISWTEPPMAILITSKNLADQQKNFFEAAWKTAKQ